MKPTRKSAIDEKWFATINKIGSFESYRFLDGNIKFRNRQKELFLEDKIKNPTPDYPFLKKNILKKIKKNLKNLKTVFCKKEKKIIIRKSYKLKIDEKMSEIEMLEAVARKNFKKFMDYSVNLYGRPSKKIFNHAIFQLKLKIKKHPVSKNFYLRKASRELWSILPSNKYPGSKLTHPSKKEISLIRYEILKEFKLLIKFKKTTSLFDAAQIKKIFKKKLKEMDVNGWKIRMNSINGVSIYVDQRKKEIIIPKLKKVYNNGMRHLLIHEIGTHVLRRENGEKSKLKLLGLGLDNSEIAEEGIATVREQATDGKFEDFSGVEGFLAVSFAAGLDGKRRDFRETFEIMKKYYLFSSLCSGEKYEEAEKYAKLAAWDRCVRTFRGTDCKTPGVCFTKDIIYRQGNINIWNVIKNNPEEIKRFSIGKYDPANPRHIWILDQLEITEKDLQDIEKEK